MNPYLLTLTFLTLMSILTSSEVMRFSHNAIGKRLYQEETNRYLAMERAHAVALYQAHHTQDSSESSSTKDKKESSQKSGNRSPSSLNLFFTCPPENSRFSLPLLLNPSLLEGTPPRGFSYYETLAQLMRHLYKDKPFFNTIPRAEYRIIDILLAHRKELATFTSPEQLSTILFEQPELHNCFYQMLKGPPSLLDFVTCKAGKTRPEKQFNLAYADPQIIHAIFTAQPHLAKEIISYRDQWMERIIAQEKERTNRDWKKDEWSNRQQLASELRKAFEQMVGRTHLDVAAYKRLFDFSLGKKGEVLYIINPITQLPTRKPYNLR